MTESTTVLSIADSQDLWNFGVANSDNAPEEVTRSASCKVAAISIYPLRLDHRWADEGSMPVVAGGQAFEELYSSVRRHLGFRAARRVKKLVSYKNGWGGPDSKAMSPMSASLLVAFLDAFHDFPVRPSLFLRRSGFLELSWEDSTGAPITVVLEDRVLAIDSAALDDEFPVQSPYDVKSIANALPR